MGKSKRFIQQSKDSIKKHAEKFPYHFTLAESEQRKQYDSAGVDLLDGK